MLSESDVNLIKVTRQNNRGMSILDLSRHVNLPFRDVLAVINPRAVLAEVMVQQPSAPVRFSNRPDLEPYEIARRDCFSVWPASAAHRIQNAHRAYDAGEIELCQGRQGATFILYAIPRRVPAMRRDYFSVRG